MYYIKYIYYIINIYTDRASTGSEKSIWQNPTPYYHENIPQTKHERTLPEHGEENPWKNSQLIS